MLATHVQTNFTAGEITPRMLGRSDVDRYVNGAQSIENFICQPHGGIIRRSGTRYIGGVYSNSHQSELISFRYSTAHSYVIEFSNLICRFIKNRAIIESAPSTPYTLVSPYTASQAAEIKYAQSADVLFICHGDIKPKKLIRSSDTSWSFEDFENRDGPYLDVNPTLNDATPTTLAPSHVSGTSRTITASAVTGINDDTGFQSTDVGRFIRIKHGSTWGYAVITAVGSTTSVTVDIEEDFGGTAAKEDWQLGAWSETTGWPQLCMFHAGRLWFASTATQPQTIWGSVTGDFENFQPSAPDGTVADDDGLTFTIDDDQVNAIYWIKSGSRGLLVGTDSGEFSMQSTGTYDPITPTNIAVRRQTWYGSKDYVRPENIGRFVVFAQRAGFQMLGTSFNFDVDQFDAEDLTLLAEHITNGGIKRISFQQQPSNVLWSVLEDGQLLGFTFKDSQKINAWHRHILGGSYQGGAAVVESIATIPDSPWDLTYLVVRRTINGSDVRYIEYMEDQFRIGDDIEDSFFVDSGLTYDGVATTSLTAAHLVGQTVSILADGGVRPDVVVGVGGAITLDREASKVHYGLSYESLVKTMPIVPQQVPGDPRGKIIGPYKFFLRFHQTGAAKIGPNAAGLKVIPFRNTNNPMDEPVPLFTGVKEYQYNFDTTRDSDVTVVCDSPLPMNLLSIISEVYIGGV